MTPLDVGTYNNNNMGYNLNVWAAAKNQNTGNSSSGRSTKSRPIDISSMFSKQKKNHDRLKESNNVPPHEGFGNIFRD